MQVYQELGQLAYLIIICNRYDIWLLYQRYAREGYTSTKTHTYPGTNGETHTKVHTYWTQKGRLFIYELMKSDGYMPLIEMEV